MGLIWCVLGTLPNVHCPHTSVTCLSKAIYILYPSLTYLQILHQLLNLHSTIHFCAWAYLAQITLMLLSTPPAPPPRLPTTSSFQDSGSHHRVPSDTALSAQAFTSSVSWLFSLACNKALYSPVCNQTLRLPFSLLWA